MDKLSPASAQAYGQLPDELQWELLVDRDPHGNVQVSKIETEKLLIDLVSDTLREWKAAGTYKGKFSSQAHFLGYEGRCAAPSTGRSGRGPASAGPWACRWRSGCSRRR